MRTLTDILNDKLISLKLDLMDADIGLTKEQKREYWLETQIELYDRYMNRCHRQKLKIDLNEFRAHLYNVINRSLRMYYKHDTGRSFIDYKKYK